MVPFAPELVTLGRLSAPLQDMLTAPPQVSWLAGLGFARINKSLSGLIPLCCKTPMRNFLLTMSGVNSHVKGTAVSSTYGRSTVRSGSISG